MPVPPARLRTLLVEDSRRLLEVLAPALKAIPGLEFVGSAASAPDAMAVFESLRPDLVVLDLVLLTGTGLEVLQRVKQRAPTCRVLVFTIHDEPQFRTRCLAAGADGFFSKVRQHQELISLLYQLGAEATAGPS